MRSSQTLEDKELSNDVLASMEEIIRTHVDELIEKYKSQLMKNGLHLDPGDVVTLRKAIREEKLKIKMTISSSINSKLLEAWNVYPVSQGQSTFDEVGDEDV